MMTYIKKMFLIIVNIGITLLVIFNNEPYAKGKNSNGKIGIESELDSVSNGFKSADKPIILSQDLIYNLFPELKNPRLMTLKDLSNLEEKESFINGGYSFVLRGDFNSDGFADLAFVGKYDDIEHPERNCFVAIISIKQKKIIRDFFLKRNVERMGLRKEIEYKPKIDAILMAYEFFGSEACEVLYWSDTKYQYESCIDINIRERGGK